jgi:hypothetical protein
VHHTLTSDAKGSHQTLASQLPGKDISKEVSQTW